MAREIPAYALAPTSMRICGEPAQIIDAIERFYGGLGVVEKRKHFSVLATFDHPDGQWCRLRSKLYFDQKGLILETMRRLGDSFLAALLYRFLTESLRNWSAGIPNVPLEFALGQIVPLLPSTAQREPPTAGPPPLNLGESIHEGWDRPEVQIFLQNHEHLSSRIRAGKGVSRKGFKRHLDRIPAVVLMGKRMVCCGAEPSERACDLIDQLIADALSCYALRE
jgi:hypothetical protein